MSQKVIIDTDIGDDIDDAIAVSFALRRPELEVVGLTTCHGPTRKRGRMLARQLSLLGRDDVPYAPGRNSPLSPVDDETREKLARHKPLEYDFVGDDAPVRPPVSDDAVEFLYETICRHAGDMALVTIGPLTNVGALLRDHPDAAGKLRWIAMMAGSYPLRKAEYNMATDPEASKIVLASETPKFLGTWEVTRRVVMSEPELEALKASDDPACAALVRQIDLWWPHKGDKPGPVVYDVCPIIWSFDRSLFTTRPLRIDVVTDGPDRGHNVEAEAAHPIDVTIGMRETAVLDMLMSTLLGQGSS